MKALVAVVMIAGAGVAMAQDHHHKQHGPGPYTGMQTRTVKALSPEQIADLKAGRGTGLALAAELNGYPGPMHVLELADGLRLTDEQRQRVQALYSDMKTEAVATGEKLITDEAALDRAFKERSISGQQLADLSGAIGRTQGELRASEVPPYDG
jgi:Spy/CpxP family protein refolding chaperone